MVKEWISRFGKGKGMLISAFFVGVMMNGKSQPIRKDFELVAGIAKNSMSDDILGAYRFTGLSSTVKASINCKKKYFEKHFQISANALNLSAAVPNTPIVRTQFYNLQMSLLWQVIHLDKSKMSIGPAISAMAHLRFLDDGLESNSEGFFGFNFCLKASQKVSNSGNVEFFLSFPFVTFYAHRKFALSPGLEYQTISFSEFSTLQTRFAYLIRIEEKIQLVLGYEVTYYHTNLKESVKALSQQWLCGVRFIVDRKRNAN